MFSLGTGLCSSCTSYESLPRNQSYGPEVDSLMEDYYQGLARAYWDSTGGFPNLDSLYAANKAAKEKKDESESQH
jgi:hypothetical protein